MKGHLSSKQLAEWTIGNRSVEEERHVGNCSVCRLELERLTASVALFAGSVRAWSEHQQRPTSLQMAMRAASLRAGPNTRPVRWLMLAACLLLAVSGAFYQNGALHRLAGDHHGSSTATAAKADTALMEQVDTDVSQTVPSTLAPLAELMYMDTGNTSETANEHNLTDDGGHQR